MPAPEGRARGACVLLLEPKALASPYCLFLVSSLAQVART